MSRTLPVAELSDVVSMYDCHISWYLILDLLRAGAVQQSQHQQYQHTCTVKLSDCLKS